MRKLFVITLLILSSAGILQAQLVGIGTSTPNAALDVTSTKTGVLLPRFTSTQRDGIGSPSDGLLIYQTDITPGLYHYFGGTWNPVGIRDNLGNHTLSNNLITGNFYLSRDGSNRGLLMGINGGVSIITKYTNTNLGSPIEGETFRFDTSGNILAKGFVLDVGNTTGAANKIPATGAGTRFMWFAARGSLRFGRALGTEWDDVNQDDFTFAGGNNVTANGYGAFAFGDQVNVSSTVGVGFGSAIKVTGTAGFGVGASNVIGGFCGVGLGYTDSAMGQGSIALGYRVLANNDYSIAIGYRGRAIHNGSLVLSDASSNSATLSTYTTSSAVNQMNARYAGGYRFFSNSGMTLGVSLAASGNSWASISDSAKKEKYTPANQEYFLNKLSALRLGSWNYKTDEVNNRHYGPMAQEIFAAFGKDPYGTIGCDTLLASADMDGIMMIMLQGLEKRTMTQQKENAVLQTQLTEITTALNLLKKENMLLKEQLALLDKLQKQMLGLQKNNDNNSGMVNK